MPADREPNALQADSVPEPEIEQIVEQAAFQSSTVMQEPQPAPARSIAPLWHTLLLVIAILGFSYWGADRGNPVDLDPIAPSAAHGGGVAKADANADLKDKSTHTNSVRLIRYGLSGVVEVVLAGWIAFGLYLRKFPFHSVLGTMPRDLNGITIEIGIAALFWLCSMTVLATLALGWNAVQERIYEHALKSDSAKPSSSSNGNATANEKRQPSDAGSKEDSSSKKDQNQSPKEQQAQMIRKLMELAPATGVEFAAWGLLCLLVGFSEEVIFRGYLQLQGIGLLRSIPAGVALSALIFGAAHGYQGLRGMCLITVYGGLFGGIALLRRNLLPGMIAHSWHDFFTGTMLAFLRSSHLLDRLQAP